MTSTPSASAAAKIRPPREAVGELAGRQREQKQRQELAEPDQAEVEGGAADREDLPADRDRDHLDPEALGDEAIQSRQ